METLAVESFDTSYYDVLERLGLQAKKSKVWAYAGMPKSSHGWKLHLSSVQAQAVSLLKLVAPVLNAYSVPFKVASDSTILGLLNEGLLGHTQVGKFITVYIDELTPDKQSELLDLLVETTQSFTGPPINTDKPLGGVVYCRYGEFSPQKKRNRLGIFESVAEEAELVKYTVPFEPPNGVGGLERYTAGEIHAPNPVKILGPGFLPIGLLKSHPKGQIQLALDMRSQEQIDKVVIKEGINGCMSDNHGRDIRHRLQHHQRIEKRVRATVRTPEVVGFFEQNECSYLATRFVEGNDLQTLVNQPYKKLDASSRKGVVELLLAVVNQVKCLHECGVVHRDLSPANIFIDADENVHLLDFELSYVVGSSDIPYTQGTVGFVSPQQEKNAIPTYSDDIYSLGSVAACLLTGVPGYHLPVGRSDLPESLAGLSGAPGTLCETIAQCLSYEAAVRPSINRLIDVLSLDFLSQSSRDDVDILKPDLKKVCHQGMSWLVKDAAKDERFGMWLSPPLESAHAAQGAPIVDWRPYRSANKGVAGVVYTLSKLWRFGFTGNDAVHAQVNSAVDWLLAHNDTSDDQLPGLHFGEAGVAVAISEALNAGLISHGDWVEPYLNEVFSAEPDWPDLTHGAAGQGLAALYCGNQLSQQWSAYADKFADYLMDQQNDDGSWTLPEGIAEIGGKSLTGYAHGVAGIVYFLARHSALRDQAASLDAAEQGALWLYDNATPDGNGSGLKWTMHAETDEAWTWWCHGSPGIAITFLALYQATKNDLYAGTARASLRSLMERQTPIRNLSQCHGVAGIGEILRQGGEVLKDSDFLRCSDELAGTLAHIGRRFNDSTTAWRVESLYHHEADLMTGNAGVIHFLARSASRSNEFGMPLDLPLLGKD